MIKSLSREVQAQLRSGIAIFSLQQCVEELVLNSIDAGATCVAVKIDIEACKVQVIDNGSGMDRENMEKVGIRYCTSKCSSLEDLDNLCFHGFRGEAIASMVTLATMVEVSSRTKLSIKTFVKRFNEGKASEVFEAQTTRPSSGTTVLICNFFHNMPVRRKRMDSVLEVERVRQRVEAISLMHSSVSFTVKKDCSGILLVQLPKARNTYYRFVQIHGFGKAQKLRETKTKNSTSASKRKKISLAAKLSHKVDAAKPQQCELNAQNDSVSKTLSDFAERFTDFLSDQCMLENNQELLPHSASNEITETAGPLENYPSDEPRVTAPHRQDVSTPTSTLITGGTKLTENMTSLDPESASGQMLYPLSQHDPLPTKAGNEEQTANENQGHEGDKRKLSSSGWLTHYDNVLGKLVHINQVTGLSKYDNPLLEETSVPCTTDVTNMAISVVSSTGFEYRCYPFQTKLVLPFLPKPRAERVLSSSINCEDPDEGPSSLSTLFSKWNNPVFVRPPQVAMDVSSGQAEDLAVKVHNILFPYRFTKDMIHSMKVINQVDKKFLACLINTTGKETTGSSKGEENLLVLVDQHAAHERVRLEGLVTESYEDSPDTPGKKRLCSSSVSPPLEINVTEEEMRLLRLYQSFLRDMALEISFPVTEKSYVLLKRLPACFIEKENTEKRRGRRSVIKSIAEEYLREHIEFLHSTGRVRGTLPLTVHNVLASQACHGAIKFNDDLSTEECFSLVAALSSCHLPFQCAHGRPSILPLADLLHLNTEQEFPKPNLRKLRRMYKAWQLYGNN
ncbi:DNA mismatch repair protein Mlh3 isoform X3 [Trichomycterus rosablanca]|uniref:DNA mismatch repair protein Mlh3 isoform X3 n=1 Tax=Trichomycterus rosablanca TaxID=2290929 RepID=UPI002F35D7B9